MDSGELKCRLAIKTTRRKDEANYTWTPLFALADRSLLSMNQTVTFGALLLILDSNDG